MTDAAAQWAQRLLVDLELEPGSPLRTRGESSAEAWARSGALWLTGPEAAPALCVAPLPSAMDGAFAVLCSLAPGPGLGSLDVASLLCERAAIAGLTRRGRVAPGGSCRLLPARDGWVAVNLPREDDVRSLPAWLGVLPENGSVPWAAASSVVASTPALELVERARMLGLAVARVAEAPAAAPCWYRVHDRGASGPASSEPPRVVDLSALWAGPLCGDLLRRAGAEVVKVESIRRPDGARAGPGAFFDLLNAGKRSVALDFQCAEGQAALRRVVDWADVVIEASRPRALSQLGLDAASWIRARPGRVWLSLTAYGLDPPHREWIGFGDDVTAASGLAFLVPGAPWSIADAPADPLAGLHGALATLAARQRGASVRLDVSLWAVAAAVAGAAAPSHAAAVSRRGDGFVVEQPGRSIRVEPPAARAAPCHAAALGADTASVLSSL